MNEEIEFWTEWLAEVEALLGTDPSLQSIDGMQSMEAFMPLIGAGGMAMNIISLVTFLLSAWGLYLINKKLGEKHPWLAFIPLIQVWTYFTASQKSFLKYFVYPLIAIFVGLIASIFTFWISMLLATVYFLYCWIVVLHGISKRTGRWAWSTVGLFFVSFIMLPVIGTKLQANNSPVEAESTTPTSSNEWEL